MSRSCLGQDYASNRHELILWDWKSKRSSSWREKLVWVFISLISFLQQSVDPILCQPWVDEEIGKAASIWGKPTLWFVILKREEVLTWKRKVVDSLYAEAVAFLNGGNFLSNFSLLEIQLLCHRANDPGDRANILLNTASRHGIIHKATQPLDRAEYITESCPGLYHFTILF